MLEAEIDIHRGLVHDNVVRLYEVIKTAYYYYIIMEYCPHGNLHEYIKQKKKLSESNALDIMNQVLAGSRYLMEQGVIHRDMKPANILRIGTPCPYPGNKWKISDFGFSVKSKYGFKDRINVGTPLYMSP
jgi:serine/threonine protein kinase